MRNYLWLGTILSALGSQGLAQSLDVGQGSVSLSFGGSIEQDAITMERGGAWNGPLDEAEAENQLTFQSANIAATGTFETGTAVTLGYGTVFSLEGDASNFNGENSWNFDDGEGSIVALSISAPLGNGLSANAGLRRIDTGATEVEQVNNRYDPCPDTDFDNCEYTNEFVNAQATVAYSNSLGNGLSYTVGGGAQFTNGWSQYQLYDDDGNDDDSANVAPLFAVLPVLTASVAYDLGAVEATASASFIGEDVSFGLGVATATGDTQSVDPEAASFAIGAFTESNSFAADRLTAWESNDLFDDSDRGTLSTEIVSAGLTGAYSTSSTDLRVSIGSIVEGTGDFGNNNASSGSGDPANTNYQEMSDASGTHANIALSSDLFATGGGMVRGDVEMDYTDITFDTVESNNGWENAYVQTLTAAFGASYHIGFASNLSGYAGLDYLISGGRTVFERDPDTSSNSNYTPSFDDSYRLRLGATYEIAGLNTTFEISGNDEAGASFALGGAWSF